jgi:tRNA (Thr-GGU) A37 N-methylase
MTVLRLLQRRGRILEVGGVDMIEGTPILDIKPYTPRDRKPDARFGWLERTCR